MKESYVKPKVMVKFPKHNYKYIWKNINNVFLDHELREFAYLFMHKALPNGCFLYKINQTRDPYSKYAMKEYLRIAFICFGGVMNLKKYVHLSKRCLGISVIID